MSEQPPWDPYGQQDPRQYQGQPQYPPQQYEQQPRRPSFTPNPQYVPPSGEPSYQGQPPYQGQPYPGQPYGPPGSQPPYPGPGYGYGPQPPRRPRRKRHLTRNTLAGIGGLVVAIIAIITISNAGRSSDSTSSGPAAAAAASAAPAAASSAAPSEPTKVGFIVSGSAPDGIDITYGPSGSDLSGPTALDGKATMSVPFDASASYYAMDAQLQGDGDITCKIVVTGPGDAPLTVSSGAASGSYNICSAQAAPENNGLSWQNDN